MAINFPASPTLNQTYTYNGRTWTWNGVGWQATGASGLSVYTKTDFTATASQTTFTVAYTVGFVDVYYNGSKLSITEYTATNGTSVVLGTACASGDIVETVAWTVSTTLNPALGVATATSLAIGGATIGTNALAVTGTTLLNSALTYGGVTLSNAVTGTGNMVLSASPTLTGTLTAAAANFSGAVTVASGATQLATKFSSTNAGGVYSAWTNTSTDVGYAGSAKIVLTSSFNLGDFAISSSGGNLYLNTASTSIFKTVGNTTVSTQTASLFTLATALNYGGVTLSNSVTGTGSMVLSASPTLTGTASMAAANFSGNVSVGGTSGSGQFSIQKASAPSLSILKTGIVEFTTSVDANNYLTTTSGSGRGISLNSGGGSFFGPAIDSDIPCGGSSNRWLGGYFAGEVSNTTDFKSTGASANANVLGAQWDFDGTNARFFAYKSTGASMLFYTTPNGGTVSEAGRFDTSGNLLVGISTPFTGDHSTISVSGGGPALWAQNRGAVPTLFVSTYSASGASAMFACYNSSTSSSAGTLAFYVASNGNALNINGSYGTISDLKLKQDIVPAKSQWDDIKTIAASMSKYRFKNDPTGPLLLGFIAQDLQKISPGLVEENNDIDPETRKETGEVTLSVKSSIVYMKAVKALGEALERIETLEARLAALEAK
jgi:hypothetical protein